MKIVSIAPTDIDSPARLISEFIKKQLADNKAVLWLVPGGSAIKIAVRARALLGKLYENNILHVALTDERYGAVNHPDSNTRQLAEAGFDTSGLKMHDVLSGATIENTTQNYSNLLENLMKEVDVVIGLFGMGADGHTAGLLPSNPIMDSPKNAGCFQGFDFLRISITPKFIRQINEKILYAVGRSKWPVIKNLETTDLPVSVLRQAGELTIFSDYKEGEL